MNHIKHALISALVMGLAACGGGGSSDPANSVDSTVGNSVTLAGTVSSGGVEKFQLATAGPSTFINILQSDADLSAFPVTSQIDTLDANIVFAGNGLIFTVDEGAAITGDKHLKVIDATGFTEVGRLGGVFTVTNINYSPDGNLLLDTVGQGLRSISLADPGAPLALRRITTFYTAFESLVLNDVLFQASGAHGLDAWDIRDINNITRLGRITFVDNGDKEEDKLVFPFQVRAIAAVDSRTLLVAARSGGLFVMDVSNPVAPVILDRYLPLDFDTRSNPELEEAELVTEFMDVEVDGSMAYLVGGDEIHVLDVSDPGKVIPVAGIEVQGVLVFDPIAEEDVETPVFIDRVSINDGFVTFAARGINGVIVHALAAGPSADYSLIPVPGDVDALDAVYQSNALYIATGTRLLKLSR